MRACKLWQLAVALIITAAASVTAQCPDGNSWTEHGDSCYKWFNSPKFWFDAEQACRYHGAHLVSIKSQQENRLVGRLSNCTNTWIGRFGTDLNRLSDPATYSWTDGSNATEFHKHDFSQLDSVHQPLIRTDGERWLNSLYHESHPFVCKLSANSTHINDNLKCSDGWSLFQRHCYISPDVEEANFNEANFYCQRKSAQLVSVMSEAELRFINTLDLSSDTCETSLDTVWIGLIKLNPCFPDSGGRELCYQWTDFSGKHVGFPSWETGHPNSEDWTVNCVTLRGDRLHSDRCHNRHRFVCKAPAVNGTDGGGIETPDGMVAAFDFRKGLQNLVDPATYPVFDDFGILRNSEDGACFNGTRLYDAYYRIGHNVSLEKTILAEKQWTMFFRMEPSFSNYYYMAAMNAHRGSHAIHYNGNFNLAVSNVNNKLYEIFVRIRSLTNKAMAHQFRLRGNSFRNGTQNDIAIAMNDQHPMVTVNGEIFDLWDRYNFTYTDPDQNQQLLFGIGSYYNAEGCSKCLGLARKQLSQQELSQAFSKYCD